MTILIKTMINGRLRDAFDRHNVSCVPEALIMMLTDRDAAQFNWRGIRQDIRHELLRWIAGKATIKELSFFIDELEQSRGIVVVRSDRGARCPKAAE
jgi:hypothetical protein